MSELFKLTGAGGVEFDVAAQGKTAPGALGAPGAPGAPRPGKCATPDATATDYFFDYKSANLTPSDKTFLETYAKAYLKSMISDPIVVEGYASMDGDKDKNLSLSRDRAAQVARYLIAQKVPKARVTFVGKGSTDFFSTSDLCQNRRATIKPPLNLTVRDFVEVVDEEPGNVAIPGKKPNVSLGEKAEESDPLILPFPSRPRWCRATWSKRP
jgi:outer membrane protein OmpA-like peptidoglycan-associated protein